MSFGKRWGSWIGGLAVLLWASAAGAVPITTGSTFTAGLVEYEILDNTGFGNDATIQGSLNGFDLTPDLTAFAFLNENLASGTFTFRATGVDFGDVIAVIDEFQIMLSGSVTANFGQVDVFAAVDIVDSTESSDLLIPPVENNFSSGVLTSGSNWSYDETWLLGDFGLAGTPLAVVVDIRVDLFAQGIGSTNLGEGMVISNANLVPGSSIPEPGTALLLGGGLLVLAAAGQSRRN